MINFNHKLHWESPCEPGIIDISPGGLNIDVYWRHLFGTKKELILDLRNPEIEIWLIKTHSSKIKDFLFK